MTKNNITREQNSDSVLRFLKARTVVYRKANFLVGLQVLLTAVVPAAMAVAGVWLMDWKGVFALAGLSIALFDMLIIDRRLGKLSADAAKLAEEFDCRLFSLPWSEILVGHRLSPEMVHGYLVKFRKSREPAILNWYPEAVSTIPHHLGVLLCQRTNLWYDSELRSHYAALIKWAGVVVFILCFVLAWRMNYTLQTTVLSIFAPMFPFFAWSIRTFWRQTDVSAAQARNLSSAETLWKQAVRGALSESKLWPEIRDLQNAIYARRSASPLILPFLYTVLRPGMEDRMSVAAEKFIEDSGMQ
jgi:hypothetical protein